MAQIRMLNDAKDELVRSNMVCRNGIDSGKREDTDKEWGKIKHLHNRAMMPRRIVAHIGGKTA